MKKILKKILGKRQSPCCRNIAEGVIVGVSIWVIQIVVATEMVDSRFFRHAPSLDPLRIIGDVHTHRGERGQWVLVENGEGSSQGNSVGWDERDGPVAHVK